MIRNVRYLFIIILVSVLTACEGIDDYIERTLDNYSSEPTSQLAALTPPTPNTRPSKQTAKAKSNGQPKAPSGKVSVIQTAEARLSMSLHVLDGGRVTRRRFISTDHHHIEEDALWRGPDKDPISAGMLLSESLAGPPVTDGEDPAEIIDHWAAFRGKRRTFGDLIGSKNAIGRVLWRRTRVSDSTCVVFLQRWSRDTPSGPASSLSGFYCAAPVEILSPGEAETVVQSLGISAPKS